MTGDTDKNRNLHKAAQDVEFFSASGLRQGENDLAELWQTIIVRSAAACHYAEMFNANFLFASLI
jgi:hypothetical protein